ncbi:MAG: hypothetical protein HRU03_03495 [Nanoarchaeales archaeon]|nr:hypothetical protein [Nanoarchaeales archaeon]
MAQKITVRFMLQVAGKPVENVQKALELVLQKIKDSKDYKYVEGEIIEPELDEESTMYSGLIECTLKFEQIEKLMGFIVDYTPNSVEIEDPQTLSFDISEFNGVLNDMSAKFLGMAQQLRQANASLHYLHNENLKLKGKSN